MEEGLCARNQTVQGIESSTASYVSLLILFVTGLTVY